MKQLSRRHALALFGAAPAAAALVWTDVEARQAHEHAMAAQAKAPAAPYRPKFFTAHEYATVGVLVDLIIPRDARSGSATDAGVPPFMDFMMIDQPGRQTAMRGGLAWLDRECVTRFDKAFSDCTAAERTKVLDDIAWPQQAPPGLSHGVAFFNSFRDLTAAGFFSSQMGVQDLKYTGNVMRPEWTGCPPEALKKLGL